MSGTAPLVVGVVAGEESGDLLAADLVASLAVASGRPVELVGVGGPHLEALGLRSEIDPGSIALMGITAIVARLPSLYASIGRVAKAIAARRPDVLLTVDSPEFSLRVAKRVKAMSPQLPIVHYVCPSVWAWRQERAPAMKAYIDRVLCILPFEVAALERLGGPPGVFVGHRLATDQGLIEAARAHRDGGGAVPGETVRLLVLPGSRRSEVRNLLEPFRQTADILEDRGMALELLLPTVPHVAPLVSAETAKWRTKPQILTDQAGKAAAFAAAHAAMAASGTVSLELALARVPSVVCYKTDPLMRMMIPRIGIWSASLPNLIADRPVLPEFYDAFVRPGMLARHLELLVRDGPVRQAQLDGFDRVADAMATDRPSGQIAADAVLSLLGS